METLQRVFIILLIAGCLFSLIPQNVSMAATTTPSSTAADIVDGVTPQEPAGDLATGLQGTVGKLLGFLQIASGLIAILMIALTGFNYIISTPEVKDEMKKKMLPIIIGLLLVFGAISVARFILGAVT